MVQLVAAIPRKNPTVVHLESRVVSFDGNGYWLLCKGRHHRLHIVSRNILKSSHTALRDTDGATSFLASAATGLVRMTGFSAERILRSKLKPVVHESAIAAVIYMVAIHELLLAQRDELTGSNLPCTFNTTSG